MLYVTLAFLFVATFLYILLGGADYGVGVLELFSSKENRAITKGAAYRVIGPVWEANHIWVIIMIVILWVGFPNYYNLIITQLHIPISLVLVDVIGRGTAFVFRHYDAYKGAGSQQVYDWIFRISSTLTPFLLGVTFGGLIAGEMVSPITLENSDFVEMYVLPWLNTFSILTGFFTVALFAYISSVFLAGEVGQELQAYYVKKVKTSLLYLVVFGALLFLESIWSERYFTNVFVNSPFSWIGIVFIGLTIPFVFKTIQNNKKNTTRLVIGAQVFAVFAVWVLPVFPNLIFLKGDHQSISILDELPPDSVYVPLGWALIIASVFVLPGLFHLFKTFGLINSKSL